MDVGRGRGEGGPADSLTITADSPSHPVTRYAPISKADSVTEKDKHNCRYTFATVVGIVYIE